MGATDATRRPREMPLAELTEHCLAARRIIETIDDPALRAAVDLLLLAVGQAVARADGEEADAA